MRYVKLLAALSVIVCLTACNNNNVPVVTDGSETIQTTAPTANIANEKSCPFGDISEDKIRLTAQAYVPCLFVPDEDMVKEIANAFNSSSWEETDINAEPILPGEIYSVFVYNEGQPFSLAFYWDGTVKYEQNDIVKKYLVSGDAYTTVVNTSYGGDPQNLEGLDGHLVWCEPENFSTEGVWLDI